MGGDRGTGESAQRPVVVRGTVQQFRAVSRRGENRLKDFRPENLQRMRIKGHRHGGTAKRGRLPAHLRHQRPMAQMDAVEVADGQRPAAVFRGQPLVPAEDLSRHSHMVNRE